MDRFPFIGTERGNAKSVTANMQQRHDRSWKVCHLCAVDGAGPRYDLWHVLFECNVTRDTNVIADVRNSCKAFLPQLCDAIEMAVAKNGESMSDTRHAGVSHGTILDAVEGVRAVSAGYDWECVPGQWLVYTLLLALPFPAVAVRPDARKPVWVCPPKRKRRGVAPEPDLHGMPTEVPVLPDVEYSLPEAVGRLFDCTVLSNDALRPLADAWCQLSEGNLLRAGAVIRPLRETVDAQRAAAAALATGNGDVARGDAEADGDGLSTSSLSSDESPPGSDAEP